MFHIFEIHYPVGDNEMKTKVAIFKRKVTVLQLLIDSTIAVFVMSESLGIYQGTKPSARPCERSLHSSLGSRQYTNK